MYFRLKELHWLLQCPRFLLARIRNSSALWKQEGQEGCFEARLLKSFIVLRIPWDEAQNPGIYNTVSPHSSFFVL
jgi:hypothetical protein